MNVNLPLGSLFFQFIDNVIQKLLLWHTMESGCKKELPE